MINLLRKIIMILFKYTISKDEIKLIRVYTRKYIQMHSKFYENSYPKLHYLVHIANDIEK